MMLFYSYCYSGKKLPRTGGANCGRGTETSDNELYRKHGRTSTRVYSFFSPWSVSSTTRSFC